MLPVRVALAMLAIAGVLTAASLEAAAREMAGRVAAALAPREVVAIEPGGGSPEDRTVRRVAMEILRARLAPPSAEAPATMRITLAKTPNSNLVVAEILREGKDAAVVVVPWQPESLTDRKTAWALEKRLIWEQEDPILDCALDGSKLYVLGANELNVHEIGPVARPPAGTAPVVRTGPLLRDLRGRLVRRDGEWRAAGAEGWPVIPGVYDAAPSPGRNYFTGALRRLDSLTNIEPFYNAALVADGMLAAASIDGKVRFYDSSLMASGTQTGFGSELVAIESPCDQRRYVIASRADERLQVFEWAQIQLKPVNEPFAISGQLRALWPAERPDEVTAVVKNPETGRYAAYRFFIACSR